jgi:8-oxo-dGTP pyrophosphatase MutT (NUDIX family)
MTPLNSFTEFAVTVRALIVDQGELFVVKHSPAFDFFALPGGKLEVGEYLTQALERELFEEIGVTADVGKLLIINDWVGPNDHRVEFFFWVRNGADYRHAQRDKATHAFEIADALFTNPATGQVKVLPAFLADRFPQIAKLGEDYPTELIRST